MRRLATGLAGALAVLALTPALALADTSATIEEVQGSPGELAIVVSLNGVPVGTGVDERDVTASVEGIPLDVRVEAISESSDIEQTAMLVMDTSDSMAGEKLTAAQAAASDFVAAIPDDVAVGLITFDSEARVVVEPTTEHAQVDAAIDQLTTAPKTLLYDGVTLAAEQLATYDVASALVLSDGADRGSTATLDDAVAAVEDSRARFDVVSFGQSTEPGRCPRGHRRCQQRHRGEGRGCGRPGRGLRCRCGQHQQPLRAHLGCARGLHRDLGDDLRVHPGGRRDRDRLDLRHPRRPPAAGGRPRPGSSSSTRTGATCRRRGQPDLGGDRRRLPRHGHRPLRVHLRGNRPRDQRHSRASGDGCRSTPSAGASRSRSRRPPSWATPRWRAARLSSLTGWSPNATSSRRSATSWMPLRCRCARRSGCSFTWV